MQDIKKLDFQKIEKKWQSKWEKKKAFEPKVGGKNKYYVLEMFPYPSGSGLHMGHAFNYTLGDIYARFKRMKGYNVLYPMGYDAFGLPAENAAIKEKTHPKKYTQKAINNFIKQQKSLGLSYDWTRILKTCDPEYYKWNQYFFLKFYENGLVYRKKSAVNYCAKCDTVLANEQVHDGKCWRHSDTEVEIKQLEQWFINTTKYAEELLKEIPNLNWPERIKSMQKNWIGKSEGTEITFKINNTDWKVFTTRPDTIFGVTFLVISAQHPQLMSIVTEKQKNHVDTFLKMARSTKQEEIDKLEKEGVFTGSYALHPLTGEKIPIYAGNFVVAEYGSGMVMAVPAHDQRDFDFAKKYNLPIKQVIKSKENSILKAYEGSGQLINSEGFNELFSEEAKTHITKALEYKQLGKAVVQYKLRDWLVSRQRYWGTPIPMIYCKECGIVPVEEKSLPVKLPDKVKFGKGNPLTTNSSFLKVKCPKCNSPARRETDTMDTFFDSSWYYLRFTDNKNNKKPFEKEKVSYWMSVDQYIGGAEHANMHLIYARFFTKALRDLGFLSINEPFMKLFNQGMIHGEDGHVMSKSRGNVIDPLEITKKYGADTLRFFLVSSASPDKDSLWSKEGIEGSLRFVKKLYTILSEIKIGSSSVKLEHWINKTIKNVTSEIEGMKYNTALINVRRLLEKIEEEKEIKKSDLLSIIKIISPVTPHIAEELWEKLGKKSLVSLEQWPKADESKISEELEAQEKIQHQTLDDIKNIIKIVQEKQNKNPEKIYLYAIPKELSVYNIQYLESKLDKKIKIFAVNDPNKYDPENKSQKAKPGKPGIYLE
ncbi:MAG: leucine--tRNA ligase [Nanoarchaeota archaeon]|nr:leucine--tRNA ligase [Nanoarchaeota archaeon]